MNLVLLKRGLPDTNFFPNVNIGRLSSHILKCQHCQQLLQDTAELSSVRPVSTQSAPWILEGHLQPAWWGLALGRALCDSASLSDLP